MPSTPAGPDLSPPSGAGRSDGHFDEPGAGSGSDDLDTQVLPPPEPWQAGGTWPAQDDPAAGRAGAAWQAGGPLSAREASQAAFRPAPGQVTGSGAWPGDEASAPRHQPSSGAWREASPGSPSGAPGHAGAGSAQLARPSDPGEPWPAKLSGWRRFRQRIGGYRPDLDGMVPGEEAKARALGMLMLCTAAVAGLGGAYFFSVILAARSQAPSWLQLAGAAVFGLFWAALILSIDRAFIMVTTKPVTAGLFLRIALATVIGFAVSTPVVLLAFSPEVGLEVERERVTAREQFDARMAPAEARIAKLNDQVATAQAVLAAKDANPLSDPAYQKYQADLKAAKATLDKAIAALGSEYAGSTANDGSGIRGEGPVYREKVKYKEIAEREYQALLSQQQTQLEAARDRADDALSARQEQAKKTLSVDPDDGVTSPAEDLERSKAGLRAQQDAFDKANAGSGGLAAQLLGLQAVRDRGAEVAIFIWSIMALFVLVEIMPVVIKAMMVAGRGSRRLSDFGDFKDGHDIERARRRITNQR